MNNTKAVRGRARRRLRSLAGLTLIVIALVVDLGVLELFAPDGTIESGELRALVVFGRLGLVAIGIAVLTGWRPKGRPSLGFPPLALLGFSIGLALVLSEGVIRLVIGPKEFWPRAMFYVGEFANRPSQNFAADSLIGWRMRPLHEFSAEVDGHETVYRANHEGFRSPYTTSEVMATKETVVLVGDSFAWGWGVDYEQSFGALLDEMLGDVVVYNMGLPGMGLDQMWMTLRHSGLPLNPDVVVVAFIDLDFTRSLTGFREPEGLNKPTFIISDGELRPQSIRDKSPAPLRWLQRNSAIWALARTMANGLGYSRPRGAWWSTNAAILDEIVRETAEAGSKLLLVRLPTMSARPFPQLATHLDTADVTFVDLASETQAGLFFQTDDHINEAGHRFVAEALGPVVRNLIR